MARGAGVRTSKTASVEIGELREAEIEAAVALWREAGLLRPWNDPRADIRLALAGPSFDDDRRPRARRASRRP